MSSVVITLIALLFSAIAMFYLRHTDAKRRRSHRQPAWAKKRYTKTAWLLSLLPGVILLLMQAFAALIMWFAAFSLIGWLIAVSKPK